MVPMVGDLYRSGEEELASFPNKGLGVFKELLVAPLESSV